MLLAGGAKAAGGLQAKTPAVVGADQQSATRACNVRCFPSCGAPGPPHNHSSAAFIQLDTPQVASARIIGPTSGELSHGNAPAAALPLEAGAFAGGRAGGEWTLTAAQG